MHPEVADSLDQAVEDVDGGAGVVEGAVVEGSWWRRRGRRGRRGGGWGLVAGHELACEMDGVEDGVVGPGQVGPACGGFEEGDIEPGVVGDEHRPGGELGEGREGGLDAGASRTMESVMPVRTEMKAGIG